MTKAGIGARGLLWVIAAWGIAHSGMAQNYVALPTSDLPWRGYDLNEHGEIVGSYQEAIYYDGSRAALAGSLGGDGRYIWSTLSSINNNHIMVGESTTSRIGSNSGPNRGMARAVDPLVMPLTRLGSLGGETGASKAAAVNDANVIVGESQIPAGARHAVRFEADGTLTDLGTLGGANSLAADVNEKGEIVGKAQDNDGKWRAFILPPDGAMRDLGTLGGAEAFAARINNKGAIIGASQTANGEQHAFLYESGNMMDLGTLGGTNSEARAINDQGVIVGVSSTTENPKAAFIVYPGRPMQKLQSLVSIQEGWILYEATAINNKGYIVALGYRDGEGFIYTFLIKPGHLATAIRGGQFELKLGGPEGTKAIIERGVSLGDWTSSTTNVIGAETLILNESFTGAAAFFRARFGD